MRKLILSAALLTATAAQAGYLQRVPGSDGHYYPSQAEIMQQQQERRHQEIMQELEQQRRMIPHCVQRALPNGQLYSYCD
jgi:ClpP class serine protease